LRPAWETPRAAVRLTPTPSQRAPGAEAAVQATTADQVLVMAMAAEVAATEAGMASATGVGAKAAEAVVRVNGEVVMAPGTKGMRCTDSLGSAVP